MEWRDSGTDIGHETKLSSFTVVIVGRVRSFIPICSFHNLCLLLSFLFSLAKCPVNTYAWCSSIWVPVWSSSLCSISQILPQLTLCNVLSLSLGLLVAFIPFIVFRLRFPMISYQCLCCAVCPFNLHGNERVQSMCVSDFLRCLCLPIHFQDDQSIVHRGLVCVHSLYEKSLLYLLSKMIILFIWCLTRRVCHVLSRAKIESRFLNFHSWFIRVFSLSLFQTASLSSLTMEPTRLHSESQME